MRFYLDSVSLEDVSFVISSKNVAVTHAFDVPTQLNEYDDAQFAVTWTIFPTIKKDNVIDRARARRKNDRHFN